MSKSNNYPPLEAISKPLLSTNEAAYYLGRTPQTLRNWSSAKKGPITPRRVGGRLGWSAAEIKKLLGVPV